MEIQEHVPLAPYTMFHIGGVARYYCIAKHDEDVIEAVRFAVAHHVPYFVLGGGSNILVSDRGFSGIVIHMKSDKMVWNEDGSLVTSDAGVSWDKLVEASVERSLYGIENLSGIPGSVGGAAGGNIGAYGSEVSSTLEWVDALDIKTGGIRRITNKECELGYRDSIFKSEKGKHLIILRAAFRLSPEGTLDRKYKDVAEYEKDTGEVATLREMRSAILAIRARKFPGDGSIGTAGSFFKNPVVTDEEANAFLKRFLSAPNFPQDDGRVKLSAAWIIDHVLNLRGVRERNVGTWPSQALVLVNYGGASGTEMKDFARMIIERAKKETGITLAPEVIFVGDE
jgi:UDP-N-acetylmuramate dehydrogenase